MVFSIFLLFLIPHIHHPSAVAGQIRKFREEKTIKKVVVIVFARRFVCCPETSMMMSFKDIP